jgi:hypothetical protein
MSEQQRPRYKEQIDIGPDILGDVSDGPHDSGRSKTNRLTRSRKSKRNGKSADWMPRS